MLLEKWYTFLSPVCVPLHSVTRWLGRLTHNRFVGGGGCTNYQAPHSNLPQGIKSMSASMSLPHCAHAAMPLAQDHVAARYSFAPEQRPPPAAASKALAYAEAHKPCRACVQSDASCHSFLSSCVPVASGSRRVSECPRTPALRVGMCQGGLTRGGGPAAPPLAVAGAEQAAAMLLQVRGGS